MNKTTECMSHANQAAKDAMFWYGRMGATSPGTALALFVGEWGLKTQLARAMGVTNNHITLLLQDKIALSDDIAAKLGELTEIPTVGWHVLRAMKARSQEATKEEVQ